MPGGNRTTNTHLWTYIGDADHPYVLFDFTKGDTADGPSRFLAGYKGYFQADLRDALPALFALGEKPTAEELLDRLPDRWLLNRTRGQPTREGHAV